MKTTFAVFALIGNLSALQLVKHPRVKNYLQTKFVNDDDFDSKNLWADMKEIRENTSTQTEENNMKYWDAENLLEQVTDRSSQEDEGPSEHTFIQMENGTIREVDPVEETMNLIQRDLRFRPNSYAENRHNEKYDFSAEERKEMKDSEDITELMEEQAKESQNVQLDESDSSDSESSDGEDDVNVQIRVLPHENDTEDISDDVNPENFDHQHSKEWNALVDKKAKEMEEEEAIQLNMKKKAKQAKQDSEEKAAKEQASAHRNRLMQLEKKERNKKFKNPSVDFAELYGSMVPDMKAVQLSALDHDNDTDDLVALDSEEGRMKPAEPVQEEEEDEE